MVKKALVLYSGGLDSRLCLKIMLEQGFEVTALYFNLPFSEESKIIKETEFVKSLNCNFKLIDVKKEPYLSSYLSMLNHPRYGYGIGYNPCIDCKIWIFKEAKKFYDKDKFDVFVTGEVLGQRPMSQLGKKIRLISKEAGFEILRPLSAKKLEETSYEKSGFVDRKKLYDIEGRNRNKQMILAKKWKMDYPSPAGGCRLCNKELKLRFPKLIKTNLITEKTLSLITIGRHFWINGCWFVVSRNFNESNILRKFKTIIKDEKGKPCVYFNKKSCKEKAKELQEAFSTGDNEKLRKKFERYKL